MYNKHKQEALQLKNSVGVVLRRSEAGLTDLGHVQLGPGDVGQLGARLDEDLREVVVVMARGHHVEAHQDVEGQGEHRQVPAAVDGRQGAGHYRTERQGLSDLLV